jgi:hypothetical protein
MRQMLLRRFRSLLFWQYTLFLGLLYFREGVVLLSFPRIGSDGSWVRTRDDSDSQCEWFRLSFLGTRLKLTMSQVKERDEKLGARAIRNNYRFL